MKNSLKVLAILSCTAAISACFGGTALDPKPDLNVDVSQHSDIKINAYFPAFGCDAKKVSDGFLANQIREMTTYQVDFHQLSESGGDTEVNKLLSTKEPVDMLKCAPTLFNSYVTDGYFTDLTDVIEKYGDTPVDSKGTKFKDIFTEEQWKACSYNGKIYGIPEYGHTAMVNQAMVWNTDHLKEVGITKIPETIKEFDDALYALQKHFGTDAGNMNYYAFGLTGNIATDNSISPAFGVPMQFYEDANGDLQNMIMSDEMANYITYVNKLKRDGIIVNDWIGQAETKSIDNFVKGYCSVYCGSYWNIKELRRSMIASYKSFPSDVKSDAQKKEYVTGTSKLCELKDDALVGWRVGLRGDGSFNSKVQDKFMSRDNRTVGFFITVPVACAKRAAYVVDWVIRKNTEESTIMLVAGKEGVHYDFTTADDPDAVALYTKPVKYIKKYDKFDEDISGMSQFQTGVYCDVAREWWPIAEAGFDAWNVLLLDENGNEDSSRVIGNPFAMHPVIAKFSKYDLKGQNHVITHVQRCINAANDADLASRIQNARNTYCENYYNKFASDINSWYKENKAK